MDSVPPDWLRTGTSVLVGGWLVIVVADVVVVSVGGATLAELAWALLVEAHSMWLVLSVLGLAVLWNEYRSTVRQAREEKRQKLDQVRGWREALEDFQRWGSPDGAHRSAGLIRRLQLAGQRIDFRGIFLAGANLSAFDLTGRDLSRANLAGADLRDAILHRARLEEADLSGARLCGLDLRTASLQDADVSDGDLAGADLTEAKLGRTLFTRANLARARLERAYLGWGKLAEARLEEAVMDGARLTFADLASAQVGGASMRNVDLRRANLGDADLTDVVLHGANLDGASLNGARLVGADLTYCNLQGADLQGAVLGYEGGSTLPPTNLTGASRHPEDPRIPGWVLTAEGTLMPDDADPSPDGLVPRVQSEE